MSDEKENLILGKFKNVEELGKSYTALEKKLSEGGIKADTNDADLVSKTKEFFKDLKDEKSSLEGGLEKLVDKANLDSGVSKKLLDVIISGTAASVQEENKLAKDKLAEEVTNLKKKLEIKKVEEEKEGTANFDKAKETIVGTEEALLDEYNQIISRQSHVWSKPNHPDHAKVATRMKDIEKKLNLLSYHNISIYFERIE